MATAVHESPYTDRRVSERRRIGSHALVRTDTMRVSWGGIFGGVLVAIGVLVLLTALGVAVGVSAAQPGETEGSTMGAAAGIWAAISLLVALFVGGFVATRIGAITDRTTGFFEGALVWIVSLLLMAYSAASGVGMLAGGAFKLVGGASQAIGTVIQGTGAGVDISGNVDQILARLKDSQTAQQISQATGMPANEVQATLNDTAQRVQANRDNPTQAAAEARDGLKRLMDQARSSGALERKAEELQPAATRAAWIAFGALLLSLLAAVLGAMAGRREPIAVTA